ncbi:MULTISPECIES: hypothetical protein [Microbulbifer]|uniref:hypothetical protein n=1 Tax=Microbulbifer TaxID=48073 RepID=UPI001141A662|nr:MULTISPECIES: hypothetical protein [Microbulbifer]
MPEPVDQSLRDFFAQGDQPVLVDAFRFRAQLGLGMAAYPLFVRLRWCLRTLLALVVGAVGYGLAFLFWGLTLGVFGRLGVALGLLAGPVGLAVVVALLCVAIYTASVRMLRAVRRAAVVEVPHYIRTPLPELARELGETLAEMLMSIAGDGRLGHTQCQRAVTRYLSRHWGLHPGFARTLVAAQACPSRQGCAGAVARLRALAVAGQIGFDSVARELLTQADRMVDDGCATFQAVAELRAALQWHQH